MLCVRSFSCVVPRRAADTEPKAGKRRHGDCLARGRVCVLPLVETIRYRAMLNDLHCKCSWRLIPVGTKTPQATLRRNSDSRLLVTRDKARPKNTYYTFDSLPDRGDWKYLWWAGEDSRLSDYSRFGGHSRPRSCNRNTVLVFPT